MVARLLWEQDAAGSNPVTSTTRLNLDAHRVPGLAFSFAFRTRVCREYFFVTQPHTCGRQFATAGVGLCDFADAIELGIFKIKNNEKTKFCI